MNDPLGLKLPELGGSLMPHRFCEADGSSSGECLAEHHITQLWITCNTLACSVDAILSEYATTAVSECIKLHNALIWHM